MTANAYPEMTDFQEIALLAIETRKNVNGNWPNRARFSHKSVRYTLSHSNEGFYLIRIDSKKHRMNMEGSMLVRDEYELRALARRIENFLTNGAAQFRL